jgi:serine/threonine protein kinase
MITDMNCLFVGAGCFGVVYKGRWKKKTVALKELRDADQLSSFAAEAGKMQSLTSHKNVVDFYGIGKYDLAVIVPLNALVV